MDAEKAYILGLLHDIGRKFGTRHLGHEYVSEEIVWGKVWQKYLCGSRVVVENLERAFQIPGGIYNFGALNDKDTYHTIYEEFANVGLDVSRIALYYGL